MKFGVIFPQTEFGNDPSAIRDFAQTAEDLGYSHILAYEHVLGVDPQAAPGFRGPYTWQDAFHEPFVLFAHMAAVTRRIGFLTGILILPQRQTALVAKQAAELALLSAGRLRLGVGVGWNALEMQALGADFHTRGARIEEQITVLRRLWQEPLVTFEGRWHHLHAVGINPRPPHPIPIWLGGNDGRVLRRAARLADGWLPNYRNLKEASAALEQLARALEDAGRAWETFGIEARFSYGTGDPEAWWRIVEDWQAADAAYLTLNTMRCGLTTPQAHLHALETFARAMM
ncbi:MAG: hypothetical protein Fur0018_02260 [Anaerolineales bacterium]